MPEFRRVAPCEDVPEGEGRSYELEDRRIALFRVNGEYHAIDDVCVHRGGPLADGPVRGSVVTCPWHGWAFDVTTGRNTRDPEIGVPTYRCRVTDGSIEVEI